MNDDQMDELVDLIFHFDSQDDLIRGTALLDAYILDQPKNMTLRMLRAHSLLTMDDAKGALIEGELAREELIHNFYLHHLLGHAYWRLGKNYMAQQSFEIALELEPKDSQALADHALFMSLERGTKLADVSAQRAVTLAPKTSDAWLALAIVQYRQHNIKDYEKTIRHCLSLDSGNPQARILLLERLQQKEDVEQAMGLSKLMMEDPNTRQAAQDFFKKRDRQKRIAEVLKNSKTLNRPMANAVDNKPVNNYILALLILIFLLAVISVLQFI